MPLIEKRFIIDDWRVRDIMGFIEPIPVTSDDQAKKVCDLLNKNWEQFNKQKCLLQKLQNENKKLRKINKDLCGRIGDLL